MAYGDFKYLTRRTASDKTLCNKPFYFAKNPKHDGYKQALLQRLIINFWVKNLSLPNGQTP